MLLQIRMSRSSLQAEAAITSGQRAVRSREREVPRYSHHCQMYARLRATCFRVQGKVTVAEDAQFIQEGFRNPMTLGDSKTGSSCALPPLACPLPGNRSAFHAL